MRIRGLLRWLIAAPLLVLAACYESEREIIPVELGEKVPFRHDVLGWAGDEEGTHFALGAAGNDVRFEHHREHEKTTGVLRALRVKDDIFAVQVRDDDAAYYTVLFYRIGPDAVTRVEVAAPAQVAALAARTGVRLTDTGFSYQKLAGEPAAMLAFVRGHAGLEFRDWKKPR
jgi:hypothetical protein